MTKKDFFILLIKAFGLYSIILTVFQIFPTLINYIGYDMGLYAILILLIPIALLLMLFRYLIFNADKILNFLKLDEGFDSDAFKLGEISKENMVTIVVIVIGGVQFLENISYFLLHSFVGFKEMIRTKGLDSTMFNQSMLQFNLQEWIIAAFNIFLSMLLISNCINIARWILRINKKNKA